MKISVITVCYNAEKTIDRTIKSVYMQTETDFEYVFIDGKSTDNTLNIIKKYQKFFNQKKIEYRFISETDKGLYDAMNKGALLARGEWLIYLNADDEFASENSLLYLQNAISSNIDVIYGDTIVIKNGSQYTEKSKSIDSIKKHLPFIPQSTIIRRTQQIKYRFHTEYKISADYDCFLRMYLQGVAFKKIEKVISIFYFGGVSNANVWETYKEDISIKNNNALLKKHSFIQLIKFLRMRIITFFT